MFYAIAENVGSNLRFILFGSDEKAARSYLEDEDNDHKMILVMSKSKMTKEDHT